MALNFYCKNSCGDTESTATIEDWELTRKALELTNLTESDKADILFPPHCAKQCFDCIAIVGKRQEKTMLLVTGDI